MQHNRRGTVVTCDIATWYDGTPVDLYTELMRIRLNMDA